MRMYTLVAIYLSLLDLTVCYPAKSDVRLQTLTL